MCEAHAFLLKRDKEEKILESVDILEVEEDEIRMINIFGEQKTLRARVRSYNGAESRILLEPVE
jgi:predicted RNA-binding protein